MFYYTIMNISKIQTTPNFYNNQKTQKREFIDVLTDNVRNPRDVNDCVAVPRGIFKAYLYLMAGSSTLMLANLIPKKQNILKTATNVSNADSFSPCLTLKYLSVTEILL